MARKVHLPYGAVMVGIFSPTRGLLVREDRFNPFWKFPGGSIEENETIEEAAQRELFQETGLWLPLAKFVHRVKEYYAGTVYISHFCTGEVTEEEFDQHVPETNFAGEKMEVEGKLRSEIPRIPDFNPKHRLYFPHIPSVSE